MERIVHLICNFELTLKKESRGILIAISFL